MREDLEKLRPSRFNLLARFGARVGGVAFALPFRDSYWAPGLDAFQDDDGWHIKRHPADQTAVRCSSDPIVPLHFLPAITEIEETEIEVPLRGSLTTAVGARCDLRLIEDRLPELTLRDLRERKRRSPLRDGRIHAWLDAQGCARRVSVADLAQLNTDTPLWTTIEFFDFGAEMPEPQFISAGG
jgi:hypothetical protein